MRLTDVRLLVDDFDACVRFYTDVVGLKLRLRVPEDVYAELQGGPEAGAGVVLGIYRRELMSNVIGSAHDRGATRPDRAALVFRVDDVDAAYRELASRGAEMLTEPHDQSTWGLRVAHLRDPDGNLIEIYRPLEQSAEAESTPA